MAALVSDFLSLLELKMEDLDLFGLADSSAAAAEAGAAAVSTVTPSESFVAAAAGLAGSRTAPFSPSFRPSSGKGLKELPAEKEKKHVQRASLQKVGTSISYFYAGYICTYF